MFFLLRETKSSRRISHSYLIFLKHCNETINPASWLSHANKERILLIKSFNLGPFKINDAWIAVDVFTHQ